MKDLLHVGLDIGSTTVKIVILNYMDIKLYLIYMMEIKKYQA